MKPATQSEINRALYGKKAGSEAQIQKAIMELLTAHNLFAFRLNTAAMKVGKRFFRAHSLGAGAADILAFIVLPIRQRDFHANGENLPTNPRYYGGIVPLWIECKSANGKQSPEQKSFEDHVHAQGHSYIVANSTERVVLHLRQMGVL